jgi:hypothetical protein
MLRNEKSPFAKLGSAIRRGGARYDVAEPYQKFVSASARHDTDRQNSCHRDACTHEPPRTCAHAHTNTCTPHTGTPAHLHLTGESPSVDKRSFMRSATCGHMRHSSDPDDLPLRHPITPTTPLRTNVALVVFALSDTISRCPRLPAPYGERKSKCFNSVSLSLPPLSLSQESKDRLTFERLP